MNSNPGTLCGYRKLEFWIEQSLSLICEQEITIPSFNWEATSFTMALSIQFTKKSQISCHCHTTEDKSWNLFTALLFNPAFYP